MDVSLFVVSIFIGIFGTTVSAVYFKKLLEKHGTFLPNALVIKMHMVSQIAKYIPGKIWGMAYQISHTSGISSAKSIVISNMEMMIGVMLLTTFISLFLLAYLFEPVLSPIAFLFGLFSFVLFFRFNLVDIFLMKVSKKYRHLKTQENIGSQLVKNELIITSLIYVLFALSYIFGNLFMLISVFHFTVDESLIYIVLLSGAWLAAVFAIIVPAGMGVREVIFVAASSYINPDASLEILTSIAVVSRFFQIFQEILGMFISFLIQEKNNQNIHA